MVIVKNQADIQKLKDDNSFENVIAVYIEELFITLSNVFCNGKVTDGFSLQNHGSIVFLQNGQDCKSLSLLGLHCEYKHTYPEYVELIQLHGKNGLVELYNACLVINNEFAITFLSTKGALDADTERFLSKECGL